MSAWEDELLELEELREEDGWFELRGPRLVCRCRAVGEDEIEGLIRAGADLDEIVRRTGATTGCSGCEGTILSMLKDAGRG
jgi:bacterioferritin-associated ferredoxin